MPAPKKDDLRDRLSRYRLVNLSVTGRRSGDKSSRPVWFVSENDRLYLLPVQGSDTQWYKNVLSKPTIGIDARGAETELKVIPITDRAQVSSVVDKFREIWRRRCETVLLKVRCGGYGAIALSLAPITLKSSSSLRECFLQNVRLFSPALRQLQLLPI